MEGGSYWVIVQGLPFTAGQEPSCGQTDGRGGGGGCRDYSRPSLYQ